MRRTRTVGRNARPAWVTRAEAAYLARVSIDEIDRWIASGRLANRQVGAVVLVDLSGLNEPAAPHAEARPVRGARARSGRADGRQQRPIVADPREHRAALPEAVRRPPEPRPAGEQPPPAVRPLRPPTAAPESVSDRIAARARPARPDAATPSPVARTLEHVARPPEAPRARPVPEPPEPAGGLDLPVPPPAPPAPPPKERGRRQRRRDRRAERVQEPTSDRPKRQEEPPADRPKRERSPRRARRAKPVEEPRRARRAKPVEEPRRARRRGLPTGAVAVGAVAGATAVALFAIQFFLFGARTAPIEERAAAPTLAAPPASPDAIPVGRDPFASPFGAKGKGDRSGGVLVKPPGVVRNGDGVAAATTVVNRSKDRWLPPSQVTFVARDATGKVIAQVSTTVSVGPGRSETVVAPDLGVDPASVVAIEAHVDAAPMRSSGYRPPAVTVSSAALSEGGKAIAGTLEVSSRAGSQARLACVVFDPLDELAGIGTTTVDLSKAADGRLRFWMTAQTDAKGPFRVSCSVS
jgi:hypothetical protein